MLILVALVAFYIGHIRAHNRLTTTHHQLEAAYDQLTASTRQIESLTLLTERNGLRESFAIRYPRTWSG